MVLDEGLKKKALRNAVNRIVKILERAEYSGTGSIEDIKGLMDKPFSWHASQPKSLHLHGERAPKQQNHDRTLKEIVQQIHLDLNSDGINEYARESEHQDFFEKAWGGPEQFRETQKYFETLYDYDGTCNILSYDDAMVELRGGIDIESYTAKEFENDIDKMKNTIAAFELHMERYLGSLSYQLTQVEAARSFVQGFMSKDEGEMPIGVTSDTATLGGDDTAETAIEQQIDNFLRGKDMDSPIILDHVRASTHEAVELFEGFAPSKMVGYYDELAAAMESNIESGHAIIQLCKDTRAHMDNIVEQEMATARNLQN